MSALPRNVRFVPKADMANSLDHLIGAGKNCRWNGEAERFRSLKIDDRRELGRRLNGQVGRLLALKDTVERNLPRGGSCR